MTSRFSVLAVLAVLLLGGCASNANENTSTATGGDAEAIEQVPVSDLYARAARLMDSGSYSEAAQAFDGVEQQYPYSQWATRAQLMSAYAHYLDLNYDSAVIGLDRFIQLHPGNENIAYAYYLRGLSFYEQISDVKRDQQMTELALDGLTEVVDRFPESRYARDANLKIDLTLDHLAGKEMEIGRYYLRREQYQAAVNRFQNVIDEYQTTTHVPEALHRLTEAYLAMGIPSEAKKTAAVLGHNYPNSDWYKDTYALMTGEDQYRAGETRGLYDKTLGRIF
tara:strand:+ start:390 stop:1229 length:840 start_codon:yes stop_codon:yes gene_type:complete